MSDNDFNDPVLTSIDHLERLLRLLPSGLLDKKLVTQLSQIHPSWPTWPSSGLSSLVGPPKVALKQFDLRWLHRFESTISLLNYFAMSLGGPSGGPSGHSLIVERAPLLGHRGWGETSAGGSCRLIRTSDTTLAVNLPREEDVSSVSAWLQTEVEHDIWNVIQSHAMNNSSRTLLQRAKLLGLAVSEVGEAKDMTINVTQKFSKGAYSRPPKVVDLSSMWAGPLCSWFLMRSGAEIKKIESTKRPDRGRIKQTPFFQRLNKGKEIIAIDFGSKRDRGQLQNSIREADIIIESSRPRAMENLGISAEEEVDRGAIWCSITGYGRKQNPNRVGFGDDAAAAGSLLAKVNKSLWFVGDASADPLTGATAAALTHGLWFAGSSGLIDISLAATSNLHTHGIIPKGITW
tara:strand:+ start:4904 stop:6115 length:1212 start_codon:yes stop_codon:yes gene_type:complete